MFAARFRIGMCAVLALMALGACSLRKIAVNTVAKTLSSAGGGTVFTGDNDPELVAEALPFAMKLYESLLAEVPENTELLLSTGSVFAMYANAFVQGPAGMLPDTQFERKAEMLARAKLLYLRGREYCLRALELRHPGFRKLLEKNQAGPLLEKMTVSDVPYLFWASASWMGAFSTNPFDMEMLITLSRPLALMDRAYRLEEGYNHGAIDEFYISVYGSLPASLGGSPEKARVHFQKAVEYTHGMKAGPYVALATSVSVPAQNVAEFKELLKKALAVDVNASPENRLENILAQRKAHWLLEHIGDFFLLEDNP
jgi:predicted anti-sigma-YlaC factor YlaD